MDNQLAGRRVEQKMLEDTLLSSKSELVAIYGRRRIGKTYLVRTIFEKELCFDLSGSLNASLEL